MAQKRVLVVDDEKQMVAALRLFFEQNGYDVATAYDGNEGLRAVGTFRPDVLVIDVMMPKENGYRVSRKLKMLGKAGGKLKVPKIILVTARDLSIDQEREEAMAVYSMADGVFYKPFRFSDLLDRVRTLTGSPSDPPPRRKPESSPPRE